MYRQNIGHWQSHWLMDCIKSFQPYDPEIDCNAETAFVRFCDTHLKVSLVQLKVSRKSI